MFRLLTSIPILALLASSAGYAATSYTGSPGSIFDPASWDNGLPTLANQGTIAADATWPVNNDINGWDLIISSGTLNDESTSFSANEIYGSSLIDIQGGTWSRNGVVRLHGGATVSVTGGTANIGGIAAISAASGGGEDGGFTLEVTAGDFVSNNVINFNNQLNTSQINVSGGSAVMGYAAADLRTIDESNTLFEISGGTLDLYSLNMSAADSNIVVTVSGGSFIVGPGGYNPNSSDGITDMRNVNFSFGSSGSWRLDGADQATFESLYGNGTLLAGGSQAAPFASVFQVNGDTLRLIPEPSATLISLLGLLVLLRRNRV